MRKGQIKLLKRAKRWNFKEEFIDMLSSEDKTLKQLDDLFYVMYCYKNADKEWIETYFNIFTTNYDNILETAMEMNHIDYFDGFEGRIKPRFSTANYGKLVCKQTALSGRLSEVVSVNLLKIHGSLYWKEEHGEIYFEDFGNKLTDILLETEQDEFLKKNKDCFIKLKENIRSNISSSTNTRDNTIHFFSTCFKFLVLF